MKTEIISGEIQGKEIDWSKVQIVKYYKAHEEYMVLTNSESTDENFEGMVISDTKNSYYNVGHMSKGWSKQCFLPVTEPLTIKFIPEP